VPNTLFESSMRNREDASMLRMAVEKLILIRTLAHSIESLIKTSFIWNESWKISEYDDR
jgi:hypothetical protein